MFTTKNGQIRNSFLCIFWDDVLTRFNQTSKYIQKEDADLQEVVTLLNSLAQYLSKLRDQFDFYEAKAQAMCEANYSDTGERKKQPSTRIQRYGGNAEHTILTGKDNFRINTFLPVIDSLFKVCSREPKLTMISMIDSAFSAIREH